MPDLERASTPERRLEWSTGLPADPAAVALARSGLRAVLEHWDLRCLVDDAELVTSELVTNMVRHGATPAELVVQWEGTSVRIAVEDAHPGNPMRARAPAGAADGRGLQIIDVLARDWGVDRSCGGKIVWAELALR